MSLKPDRRLLAVTMGDPAGIGPEVVVKAICQLPVNLRKRVVVFGEVPILKLQGGSMPINVVMQDRLDIDPYSINVIETSKSKFTKADYGKSLAKCGRAAMGAVTEGVKAVLNGQIKALVTAPINKKSANRAGYEIAGHTEYLAELAGGVDVAMMLASDMLRVVVATTHIALRDVSSKLSKDGLLKVMRVVDKSIKAMGLNHPQLSVCGLNPHASDDGLFGDEETKIISPAINMAKNRGICVTGPHPADTMFTKRARDNYDVAIAMYHDQGLVAIKALSFGKTVNITLGLPFLRVSVDHGTAFDIAGQGVADPGPMIYAIKTADRILKGNYFT